MDETKVSKDSFIGLRTNNKKLHKLSIIINRQGMDKLFFLNMTLHSFIHEENQCKTQQNVEIKFFIVDTFIDIIVMISKK